jgi:hypothetical protein
MHRAISSLLHLFACFSFFGAALFFLSLPFLPNVRIQLCAILLDRPNTLYRVGFVCLAASLILTLGFYAFYRGRSMLIGMGASVDAAVILKTLEPFFKEHFDGRMELSDIHFSSRGKLEIEVFSQSEDPHLLARVEGGITSLLKERFGYAKPFLLSLKKY